MKEVHPILSPQNNYKNNPFLFQGGNYVVNLLDNHGAPISILFICFLEAVAVNWCYGKFRIYLIKI